MSRFFPSLALGAGAAFLLLLPAGCAQRTPLGDSGSGASAVLMECNAGRTNCLEVARYSTLEVCNRERASYLARNPLREAYCTTDAAANR